VFFNLISVCLLLCLEFKGLLQLQKCLKEHVSTYNMGINGKILFVFWNFMIQTYFQYYISSINWKHDIFLWKCMSTVSMLKSHTCVC